MLPDDLHQLRAALGAAIDERDDLHPLRERVEQAAEACVIFRETKQHDDEDASPVGCCKIGGLPDLPDALQWPTHEGKGLPFVAQLDLSTLPRWQDCPLPTSGYLWLFALVNDDHYPPLTAVLFAEATAGDLKRRALPEAMHGDWSDYTLYDAAEVAGEVSLSIDLEQTLGDDYDDDEVFDALHELIDTFNTSDRYDGSQPAGQMLGTMNFPDETPAGLAEMFGKDGDDWMSLVEVQSVGSMMWSDMGILSFCIRRSQLEQRDFSDVFSCVLSS